jgi:hypothetical protein
LTVVFFVAVVGPESEKMGAASPSVNAVVVALVPRSAPSEGPERVAVTFAL